MKKLYLLLFYCVPFLLGETSFAQNCAQLTATFKTYESRCAATGAIKVSTTGGTGSYKYKVSGPVNSNFTTSDSITGLSAGNYTIEVVDIGTNCKFEANNIIVRGNYKDPRFNLKTVSVGCDNGTNGMITTEGLTNGRSPFTFTIVAPSPMGIGTTSTNGNFTGLSAGDYTIRLMDSCGGIQTRTVSIQNYTWRIDSYSFVKLSCDFASGYIKVIDSRGNVSTIGGIPGMSYGILTVGTDTTWSSDPNFEFNVFHVNSMQAFARDSCGNIKMISTSLFLNPSLGALVTTTDKSCNSFTASVTSIKNFYDPEFCLYDENDQLVNCNNTGVFSGLPYGNYCIKAHDDCSDSTIIRCFSASPPIPSIGALIQISNKTCTTFSATVTGQSNLTNPFYCIYNSSAVQVACNATGQFDNLPYGDYCIVTRDGCIDTTMTRCISIERPQPKVEETIVPSYVNCVNFGLELSGDSLTLPTYCLLDTLNNTIACNNTGIFDSIPLGSYCVTVHDACLDTTFKRCFAVGPPTTTNDLTINQTNQACSTFTAKVSTTNLAGGAFCLYDDADNFIRCDSSGTFDGLAYGSYCIKASSSCPDTTVVTCFLASPPIPSVGASASIINRTCSTFTARVARLQNLTNPTFCLVNEVFDTLACNSTGRFDNLAYGSYCIVVKNECYDTTIKVCFTTVPDPFEISAAATKSCNYGYSKFNISSSTYPVNVQILDTSNNIIYSESISLSTAVDSIPNLPAGFYYKIVGEDACGNRDTALLAPEIAFLNHKITVKQRCPGSIWPDGSGNIVSTVTTNTGALTVRITKKDAFPYSPYLVPDAVKDSLYTFSDLGPGTYIVRYNSNDGCNVYLYDTVIVKPYQFPNLSRSTAYQCDVNGFSVGAVASEGVGPFTFEIIGSTPDIPSIIAGPQTDPIFRIDNGFNYSLIRLRALDACGNATLGDASILPMANNGIKVSQNCFGAEAILSIDTVFNSTISWYFKTASNATDSVFLGSEFSYNISELTPADTGYYVCHLNVNNGCINRSYSFHITGDCYPILPVLLVEFTGRYIGSKSLLNWSIRNDLGLKTILVERLENDQYKTIGSVDVSAYISPGQYSFTDENPLQDNFYRLKLLFEDGKQKYSKVLHLSASVNDLVRIYPNPSVDLVNVEFKNPNHQAYKLELINMVSQKTMLKEEINGNKYTIYRTASMVAGMYILKVTNSQTGEVNNFKIIFNSK